MSAYDPAEVDLLSAAVRNDPYPYFAWLRVHAPVTWSEPLQAFLITRYDDVAAILRDPSTFSSIAMRRSAPGRDAGDRGGHSVITSDPPEHTRLRTILQDEFRQRPLRELEPRVRDLVATLGTRLEAQDGFDLVRDFTIPLPVTVIAELLDIAPARHEDFKRWSDCLIKILNDREGPEWLQARAGVHEVIAFFKDELEARSSDYAGRRDILAVLLEAGAEGRLDRREMVAYAILLLTGGNETTTNLLGGMTLALFEQPEQLDLLRREPSLIPNAIEEGLRYCSPVQGVYRRAMREVELAGVTIPAQRDIVVMLGSANHDETRFRAPERFDVQRHTGGHAGFGMGIHHCLGAHLGRLEARLALEWLVPRLARLERDGDTVHWNPNWFVRGPEILTLRWRDPAANRASML